MLKQGHHYHELGTHALSKQIDYNYLKMTLFIVEVQLAQTNGFMESNNALAKDSKVFASRDNCVYHGRNSLIPLVSEYVVYREETQVT